MRYLSSKVLVAAGVAVWVTAICFGGVKLWRYESTAGEPAHSPMTWPTAATIVREPHLPTLLMFVHPQCPCSKASMDELARLMAHCTGKVQAMVLMVRPEGEPEGWERSDLWADAAAIPGVQVMSDGGGAEAERFGAATSGQVMLYDAGGRLVFGGGITESRGHSGDNGGESAIVSLVLGEAGGGVAGGQPASAPVYGCSLLNKPSVLTEKECKACRQ